MVTYTDADIPESILSVLSRETTAEYFVTPELEVLALLLISVTVPSNASSSLIEEI